MNGERRIKAELGRGDMIRKGVTLRDINFRMGTVDFKSTRNQFNYRINNNYLYFKSTTPTVFGSYADPAFEVHFDSSLSGAIILPPGGVKPRVDRVIASVPRITIKPRNVTGGVVTTVVAFFQATAAGGRMIQEAHDKHLNVNLTPRINDYLARF